ncbi:MAG TPA: hypothetical protein VKZ78_04410 [Sphingobacteriaceae bacterium]|nr:hypothetical protein [Sphingobacteriaceae bacterium]
MKKAIKIKSFFLVAGLLLASSPGFSMSEFSIQDISVQDTLKTEKIKLPGDTIIIEDIKTGEKRKIKIILPGQDDGIFTVQKSDRVINLDTSSNRQNKRVSNRRGPKPIFGITFSRIDLGLTKPMVDGSFKMAGENEIFNYRPGKTVNFGFDVLQAGYRFNRNFKIYASAGFDWTYIRLRKDLIFDPEGSPYTTAQPAGEDISKNRLTSTYMRLPLTFEFRSADQKTKIAFGPITGFLLKGTQRFRQENGDRVKKKGEFGYAPFQYGAFARFGVGSMGIYGKYYFNDMFDNSPAGAGLQNLTFGLTLGF